MTYPSRLPDPEDKRPSYSDLEDDAMEGIGLAGLVVAVAIISIVLIVGSYLENHPGALAVLGIR